MTDAVGDLIAALADRYRIEMTPDGQPRVLGRGGMAAVYLARDLKHRRLVAVKVLSPELAAVLGSERFLHEIEIAAGLHHPHIVPLYDSGVAAGRLYYVMPYVQGESLRSRLNREKQLTIAEALQLTDEVADALAFAHAHDVVHRDVKPENILLDSGHAVVADFGIARAVTVAGGPNLTDSGVALGTPTYMAPEQVGSGGVIDGRTDQYGLASVLYEMLAGRPPFAGSSAQAIIAQRFTTMARPLKELRPEVPATVDQAVQRGLSRVADDRFASMALFATALRTAQPTSFKPARPRARTRNIWIGAVGAAIAVLASGAIYTLRPRRERSIAVLPMTTVGGDTTNDYFTAGLTDELTSVLGKIPELKVASRNSALTFKDKPLPPFETIGRRLHVESLMTATVQRAEGRLRIRAQLVNAADGFILWSENYERPARDIFPLQEELAKSIAAALRVTLGGQVAREVERHGTSNLEAYDLYLQGRYFWSGRSLDDLEKAVRFFDQAIQKDSNYALAYSGLSDSYGLLATFGEAPPDSLFPKARAMARRALALDPNLPEAITSKGFVELNYDWDWRAADSSFATALRIDPRYTQARLFRVSYLASIGRLGEAVREAERAIENDPLWLLPRLRLGNALYLQHDYGRAIDQFRKVLELNPKYGFAQFWQVYAFSQAGMHDSAVVWARKFQAGFSYRGQGVAAPGVAYGRAGRREEALGALAALKAELPKRYISPYAFAQVFATLGERDSAFAWLDKAYLDRTWSLIWMRAEPIFDKLHSDARWDALVHKMRFP